MPKIKDLPKQKRPRKKLSEKGAENLSDAKSQIIIYKTETGKTKIDVRFDGDTVWLTQKLLATLFRVTIPTINEHIKNIYNEGELKESSTIRKFLIVQKEGNRQNDFDSVALHALEIAKKKKK